MKCPGIMILALLLLAATRLHAEPVADKDLAALWEVQVVAFGQNFPAYPSSSDQNLTLLPLPFPVYRGKVLRFGESLEDLASGRVLDAKRVKLSIDVGASFPEDSSKLNARTGMPDLDFLLQVGPELEVSLNGSADDDRELNLSMQLRGAVSFDGLDATGRGVVFNPELEYLVRDLLGPKNELRFRVSSTWANSRYMNYFYGVTPDFATANRSAFDASSGYLNTEFLVGLNRKITDRLEFRGSVRLWINKGATNDASPLYERDYDRGIRLALFWTAFESKRRASGGG